MISNIEAISNLILPVVLFEDQNEIKVLNNSTFHEITLSHNLDAFLSSFRIEIFFASRQPTTQDDGTITFSKVRIFNAIRFLVQDLFSLEPITTSQLSTENTIAGIMPRGNVLYIGSTPQYTEIYVGRLASLNKIVISCNSMSSFPYVKRKVLLYN